MNRKADRVVVVLLLMAAVVRFPGLGTRSLWFDEALSGVIARLSTVQVLTNAAGSVHPPGYYFLLHLWQIAGESEFALRFPSVWCSIASVALVARLGYDLFGRRAARLAALGMALAPFQVYYAQEARMYGLVTALGAGLLWSFVQGMRGGGRKGWWGYSLCTLLGLYVHYFVGLVVLALHLWLLLDRRSLRRALRPLLIADVLTGLAFAPQVVQVPDGATLVAQWLVVRHPLEPLRTFHYLLFGYVMPLWVVPVCLFLIISLLAFGVLWISRRRDRMGWMLTLVVLLPIVSALLVSLLVTPLYLERSFAVVTPALMVLLARGVVIVPRRSPMPYLGTALVVLMVAGVVMFHTQADPAKPPLREALSVVVQGAEDSDVILHLQDASYLPSLYYERGRAGVLVDAGQRLWLSPTVYALFGGEVIQSDDFSLADRVWLTLMPGYMGTRQQGFLNAWEAAHPTIQSWDWGLPVQVRLYAQGD